MADIIIAIDIGNTGIKIGLFKDDLITKATIKTGPLKESSFYEKILRKFIGDEQPVGGVLSSVVPSHGRIFSTLLKTLTGKPPLVVDHSVDTGLEFGVIEPCSIGADRIANAAAARDRIKGDLVVVDLGTATTLTAVNKEGVLLGGMIMPGMQMMCIALNEQTGKLPLVRLSPPPGPLGNDTKSSIISGVVYGTAGAVERLIEETASVMRDSVTIMTGGNAPLIKELLKKDFLYLPDLTLTGLKIIHERNRGGPGRS